MTIDTATLAWPGGQAQKDAVLAARHEDVAADRLKAGSYMYVSGDNWEACDIGCLARHILPDAPVGRISQYLTGDWHETVGRALGWTESYCHLRDRIFESLSGGARTDWSTRAIEAVPVGGDTGRAVDMLMADLLSDDPIIGVQRHVSGDGLAAIVAARGLFVRRLAGDEPAHDEWRIARDAAAYAAIHAHGAAIYAHDAAYAAYAYAAYAYAADAAYACAAYAYAYAADADAFWSALAERLNQHASHSRGGI